MSMKLLMVGAVLSFYVAMSVASDGKVIQNQISVPYAGGYAIVIFYTDGTRVVQRPDRYDSDTVNDLLVEIARLRIVSHQRTEDSKETFEGL